jgi:hypothetical protein
VLDAATDNRRDLLMRLGGVAANEIRSHARTLLPASGPIDSAGRYFAAGAGPINSISAKALTALPAACENLSR